LSGKGLPENCNDYLAQWHKLEQKVITGNLWCGRHVLVIDGTSVSMPDIFLNQKLILNPAVKQLAVAFLLLKIEPYSVSQALPYLIS